MLRLETPQSVCRFGIARRDITPPVGIYHRMWGAAAHDRSTGVHRPLEAAAIVLRPATPDDETAEQVFIALDHVLFWAREMEDLLETIAAQSGVERNRIVVTFSHTHSAGLMGRERAGLPGGKLIGPYMSRLGSQLAEITRWARESTELVTITYATGRCSLAANRDLRDPASGQFVCGLNPAGPTDDTLLVARVTNASGRTIAVIVNYACHPTTLAWQNSLISPDFPGAMREVIESVARAPCVFLQGASGDLGPREGYSGDSALADKNGRELGYAALSGLESLPPPGTAFEYTGPVVSGATLGTWAHRPCDDATRRRQSNFHAERVVVELPYRTDLPHLAAVEADRKHWETIESSARTAGDQKRAAEARAMVERAIRLETRLGTLPPGKMFPYPVVLCRIGDAVWIGLEGELYHWFQRTLRNRYPDRALMIVELANGSRCFYLPTEDSYGKGIYQESVAVLAAGSLERLLEAVDRQVRDILSE
jgi:hypothetical protein